MYFSFQSPERNLFNFVLPAKRSSNFSLLPTIIFGLSVPLTSQFWNSFSIVTFDLYICTPSIFWPIVIRILLKWQCFLQRGLVVTETPGIFQTLLGTLEDSATALSEIRRYLRRVSAHADWHHCIKYLFLLNAFSTANLAYARKKTWIAPLAGLYLRTTQ